MNVSRLALAVVEPHIEVLNPFDGSIVGTVADVCASEVPHLLESGRNGAKACAALPRHRRASILEQAALNIERDAKAFARLIVDEAGKTLKQAEKKKSNAASTPSSSPPKKPSATPAKSYRSTPTKAPNRARAGSPVNPWA
nr:hypothetical protein GCM10020185_43630 [Pseudomonas brassicacearum subsp. brassicacearum]